MGLPDQLLKYLFEVETPTVTAQRAVFVRAPEIATSELRPDGVLRVRKNRRLDALPAPWCTLEREATLDGKMPGDHLDPLAFERCLLRRAVRQVQRLAEEKADPTPAHGAAWIVSPHWPEWLAAWAQAGVIEMHDVGAGCVRIGPSLFPIVWIAANELPLDEALMPFLVARSGTKLKEFVQWAVARRPPEWMERVVQCLPEVAKMLPEFNPVMTPEERAEVIDGLRVAVEAYPEAANRLLERDREEQHTQQLTRQFTRRLGRAFTADEQRVFTQRLGSLGAERLGDVVLDLGSAQLAAWLADPVAR